MKHVGRKLLLPVVGLALAGGGFAFLDGGTVDTSYASAAVGTVSGYHASNIKYKTASSGSSITDVLFTLNHPATPANVSAALGDSNGVNYNTYSYPNCSITGYADGSTQHEPMFDCSNSSGYDAPNVNYNPYNPGGPANEQPYNLEVTAAS